MRFDGLPLSGITVENGQRITGFTPPGIAGDADVDVLSTAGAVHVDRGYAYILTGDTFAGGFSGGPLVTMPLKFIPSTFGNWSLKAGVQFLVLNSNLKAVNTNDSFVPIGSVGLSLTY